MELPYLSTSSIYYNISSQTDTQLVIFTNILIESVTFSATQLNQNNDWVITYSEGQIPLGTPTNQINQSLLSIFPFAQGCLLELAENYNVNHAFFIIDKTKMKIASQFPDALYTQAVDSFKIPGYTILRSRTGTVDYFVISQETQ